MERASGRWTGHRVGLGAPDPAELTGGLPEGSGPGRAQPARGWPSPHTVCSAGPRGQLTVLPAPPPLPHCPALLLCGMCWMLGCSPQGPRISGRQQAPLKTPRRGLFRGCRDDRCLEREVKWLLTKRMRTLSVEPGAGVGGSGQ